MIKTQTCIVCGRQQRARLIRGLCTRDYERFRRAKAKLPLDQQDLFDDEMVVKGKIGKDKKGSRGLEDDVFANELAMFLAKPPNTTYHVDQVGIALTAAERAKKHTAEEKQQQTKRTKKG